MKPLGRIVKLMDIKKINTWLDEQKERELERHRQAKNSDGIRSPAACMALGYLQCIGQLQELLKDKM